MHSPTMTLRLKRVSALVGASANAAVIWFDLGVHTLVAPYTRPSCTFEFAPWKLTLKWLFLCVGLPMMFYICSHVARIRTPCKGTLVDSSAAFTSVYNYCC